VKTTTDRMRSEDVPIDAFHVSYDERVVKVDVNS
jgi:hypothetical protein